MAALSHPIHRQFALLYGILLQLLLLAIEQTSACSVPPGWTGKHIKDRMRAATAEIVVKGKILKKYPPEDIPAMGGKVYPVRIDVLCVLKGPLVEERITVTGFGETEDCVTTHVNVGDTYVVLMMPFEDRYRIVEVNSQPGAERYLPRYSTLIEKSYPCEDPITLPPTTPMPTTIPECSETTMEMSTEGRGCKSCSVYSTLFVAFVLVQVTVKFCATVVA